MTSLKRVIPETLLIVDMEKFMPGRYQIYASRSSDEPKPGRGGFGCDPFMSSTFFDISKEYQSVKELDAEISQFVESLDYPVHPCTAILKG